MERPEAMAWLDAWRDKHIIKVITGIRRCGKSTVLAQYRDRLLAQGIPPGRIAFFDFEDPDTPEFASWKEAWEAIRPVAGGPEKGYVFLDEVQRVPEYEKLVDGLSETAEDIIARHMWPAAGSRAPGSPEGFIVSMADKAATIEDFFRGSSVKPADFRTTVQTIAKRSGIDIWKTKKRQ